MSLGLYHSIPAHFLWTAPSHPSMVGGCLSKYASKWTSFPLSCYVSSFFTVILKITDIPESPSKRHQWIPEGPILIILLPGKVSASYVLKVGAMISTQQMSKSVTSSSYAASTDKSYQVQWHQMKWSSFQSMLFCVRIYQNLSFRYFPNPQKYF